MTDRILVTGGTGKTGQHVAELLRARDLPLVVATRSPTRADQVRLDWADTATFAPALEGASAVYLVAPTDRTDHLAVMKPFLQEAVRRDIGSIVLLSASSLPEGGPMMGEVHAWLREHAPRWTALRPSWFMQNFVTQHLSGIVADGRIYSATESGRVAFIDAKDIAAVAVEKLLAPTNDDPIVTGPTALSYDDVAEAISRSTGRSVVHSRLTVEELAARYEQAGLPSEYARILAGMDAAVAEGAEDRVTDEVERATGQAATTFDAFLSANQAALQPAQRSTFLADEAR